MADTSTIVTIAQTGTLQLEGRGGEEALIRLRNHLNGIISGAKRATTVKVFGDGAALVAATGTVTYATSSGAQTVVINGVTVASFAHQGSDTANATKAAADINASSNALIQYLVTATSSAGVVTITASVPGITGNTMTLSVTGTGATASGARLTGGAGGNVTPTTISV